jgi:hypothetical protein
MNSFGSRRFDAPAVVDGVQDSAVIIFASLDATRSLVLRIILGIILYFYMQEPRKADETYLDSLRMFDFSEQYVSRSEVVMEVSFVVKLCKSLIHCIPG